MERTRKICENEEEDINKIDISKLSEDDLYEHQCKVLIIFGMCFGFRGDQEHTFLTMPEIGHGFFPNNHPLYPGKEWWGLSFIKKDKKAKLSLGKSMSANAKKTLVSFLFLVMEKTVM